MSSTLSAAATYVSNCIGSPMLPAMPRIKCRILQPQFTILQQDDKRSFGSLSTQPLQHGSQTPCLALYLQYLFHALSSNSCKIQT